MNDQNREYWDKHAKRYDRSMLLLGRPIPRMLGLIGHAVRGASRVLEVAAGTGLVTAVLAREAASVISTDYSLEMVSMLTSRVRALGATNVKCEQADLYALPFDPGSFDAVIAANVLHLVPDLEGAIASLRRMLKPDGRLVAPTFCHDETVVSRTVSSLLAVTGFPGHRRFTLESLGASVEAAGLRLERVEVIPGLLPIGYVEGLSFSSRGLA